MYENSATAAFEARIEEARELVAAISARLDDHLGLSPNDIKWGHAGSAINLVDHLRQAAYAAGAIPDKNDPQN